MPWKEGEAQRKKFLIRGILSSNNISCTLCRDQTIEIYSGRKGNPKIAICQKALDRILRNSGFN